MVFTARKKKLEEKNSGRRNKNPSKPPPTPLYVYKKSKIYFAKKIVTINLDEMNRQFRHCQCL